jgi:hypothetical protein
VEVLDQDVRVLEMNRVRIVSSIAVCDSLHIGHRNNNSALPSHSDWCPLTIWSPVATRECGFDECRRKEWRFRRAEYPRSNHDLVSEWSILVAVTMTKPSGPCLTFSWSSVSYKTKLHQCGNPINTSIGPSALSHASFAGMVKSTRRTD